MTTIRVKKDKRYFSASNEPFNDERLSWEARGLMGYLLSKPNDWKIRMGDLEKRGPAGGRKIKRMLAELRLNGYMNRIRLKLENGKFDWITDVYESPSQNPHTSTEIIKTSVLKRTSGKASSTKRTSAKPTGAKRSDLKKTDPLSTKKASTKIIINSLTLEAFTEVFGKFNSEHEKERWQTFYDSVGPDRAKEIIAWAEKKEIHLANRPSLIDALETAARKWKTPEQRKQTAAQRGDRKQYIGGDYAEYIEH
jgi:hypothetical protein